MRGLVAVLALLVLFASGSEAASRPVPRGEIFVVGLDGRGRQNLTRSAATESELVLSPDGRRIAYVRSEGVRGQIWVMNVDGSGQRRLTSGGDWEFGPQWSPDGHRLAYMVWDDSACTPESGSGCAVPDVLTVDADGSGHRKVLDSAFQPRWSPDGSKPFPAARRESRSRHAGRLRRKQRRHPRETARSSEPLGSPRAPPAWSPTGRTILYGVGMGALSASTFSASTAAEGGSSPSAYRRRGRTTAAGSPSRAAARPGHPLARGRPRRIAAASTRHTIPFPAWSPAGKQLAYNSGNQLYVAP